MGRLSLKGPSLGLILIGQRGTGKTTLGGLLARHWGLPFSDSDQEFQREHACTSGDWIRRFGEVSFRVEEERIVGRLFHDLRKAPRILALGGGAPTTGTTKKGLEELRLFGSSILYLTCPMELALSRMEKRFEAEPLLREGTPKGDWEQLFLERHRSYAALADHQFENDFENPETALKALLPMLERSD